MTISFPSSSERTCVKSTLLATACLVAACGDDGGPAGGGGAGGNRPTFQCDLSAEEPNVVELTSVGQLTLARFSDGSLWCWGTDDKRSCPGSNGYAPYTFKSPGLSCLHSMKFDSVAVGLVADDRLLLWGNYYLGFDFEDEAAEVHEIVPGLGTIAEVSAGRSFYGLLTADGTVYLRGKFPIDHTSTEEYIDHREAGFSGRALRVFSADPLCALLEGGVVSCFGLDIEGTLGLGEQQVVTEPTELPLPGPVKDLVLDPWNGCALLQNGEVYCSGDNTNGSLGVLPGELEETRTFVLVEGLPPIERVKMATLSKVCGLSDATLWCWGGNGFEEIQAGGAGRLLPTPVEGFDDIVDFAVGEYHICVLREDGSVWCRGAVYTEGDCQEAFEWSEASFPGCV